MKDNLSKRKLEKMCIDLVGEGYFNLLKSNHISQYGKDMYEKALPVFLDKFDKQVEMLTNTTPNSVKIDDIKVVLSCLFARGKNVIDIKRAEDITMEVLGLLIEKSNIFAQMVTLYLESSKIHDVGLYPKVFSITDPTMGRVTEYHQGKELFSFIESKGFKVNIIDSARQIFSYTYFDKKTRKNIDCIIYFHV